MDKIISKLKTEPVRLRLYGLAVVVVTYLLANGYVNASDAEFVLGVASLVLAVESSRRKVKPTRKS